MPEANNKIPAPELKGSQWLNSPPITNENLRGKPYLVDFWDYTCVNCIRTLPYVKGWQERYASHGLRVIGVHAPEFSFARQNSAVLDAIESFEIKYPVVLDNDYMIWKAFNNQYWPAKYLVDAEGNIRYYHFGEGGYHETESMLQRLIRDAQPEAVLPQLMEPVREDDRPGAVCYAATHELYLGYSRARLGNPHGAKPDEPSTYRDLGLHAEGYIYLDGTWVVSGEFASYHNMSAAPGKVAIKYTAKEVNLVMNPLQAGPAQVSLLQDGVTLEQRDWGEDVKPDEKGNPIIAVEGPRMYKLVRNRDFGSHELTLVTKSHGLAMYAFTFGSCTVAPA